MPLISDNLVSAWYSRTSWVYKSFAFLFVNPLWQKPVPQGFSLCPLFWLALFSLFLFRPLVYLTLGVGYAVKSLRLGKLIRFTDLLVVRVLGLSEEQPLVMPTVAGIMLTVMAALVISLAVFAVISYWTAGVFSMLVLPVLLTAMLACCVNYANGYHPLDRCPVEVYVRVIAVLSIIVSALLHPAATYMTFVTWPGEAASFVWFAISFSFVTVMYWLWAGGVWTLRFMPWVLAMGGAAVIYGWIATRLDRPVKAEAQVAKVSAAERRKRLKQLAETCWYQDGWGDAVNCSWWMRMILRCDDLLNSYLDSLIWDSDEVHAKLSAELMRRAEIEREKERALQARRAAQCKAATDGLIWVCTPVIVVCKQLAILSSYLWQFAKARKSGVCPYLRFHD